MKNLEELLVVSWTKKVHPLIFNANTREERNHEKVPFLFIALTFESYAKDKASKSSDIDLMINWEYNFSTSLRHTFNDINTWRIPWGMAKSRELNVVSEAINKNT